VAVAAREVYLRGEIAPSSTIESESKAITTTGKSSKEQGQEGRGQMRRFAALGFNPEPPPHRGAAKKKIDGPPRPFAKSQTHPPTIRLFFFLTFFFSTFLGVSRRGEFKNTTKIFWQKVRVENFSQNFDKNFDVSFSSTFVVLSHFRVFFSDGSSKTLQKTFCKKNRVEKFLPKIRPKVQNRLFLDFFLITFLGVSRQGE
jgi:hypothetical protein